MADYCDSPHLLTRTRGVLAVVLCGVLISAVFLSCSSDEPRKASRLAPGRFNADSFLPGSLPGIALQTMSVRKTEEEIERYMGSRAGDYYDYHLVGLVAALYDADSVRLSVEIAQFAGALDAYGFYALTRPDNVELTKLGAEGYMEGHSFYFVVGPYAVTISAISDSAGVTDLVQRLAVSISAKIGMDGVLPDAFTVFPARNRIPVSYRYFPVSFLAAPNLDSVLTCRYDVDSAACTLFITGDGSGKKYLAMSIRADSLGGANPAPEEIGFDENYGVIYSETDSAVVLAGLVSGRLVGVIDYVPEKHEALFTAWVAELREE